MKLNELLAVLNPIYFPKKDYEPISGKEATQHIEERVGRLRELAMEDDEIDPYRSWSGRSLCTQSVIETLVKPGDLVVEVGIGNNAPTLRELIESGQRHNYSIKAIEVNKRKVPGDLKGNVVVSDITRPTPDAQELLSRAKVVRMSNLLHPGFSYFEPEEVQETLYRLGQIMPEQSSILVAHTHDLEGTAEEAFFYKKREGALELVSFLYSVVARGGNIYAGGHSMHTVFNENGLRNFLVATPAYADEKIGRFLREEYAKRTKSEPDDQQITEQVNKAMQDYFIQQELGITRRGRMFEVPIHFIRFASKTEAERDYLKRKLEEALGQLDRIEKKKDDRK